MADAIFISYRRDDSEGEAGRLFDDLTRAFGNDAVFMDVVGIKPGVDFRRAIEDNVASCGVLLAIVGRTWATIANPDGVRRLEDPSDFVSLEIASALKREVPVIPVLVHDAKMPSVDLLPESLKSFAFHNSVELSHARWGSDVALLIEALKAYVTPPSSKQTASESPVHATVPVQLPAPHRPTGTVVPTVAKSRLPVFIGALAGIVILVAVIAYVHFKPGPDTTQVTPVITPAVNSNTDPARPTPAPAATPAAQTTSAPGAVTAAAARTAPAAMIAPAVKSPGSEFDGVWKRTDSHGDVDALGLLVISGAGSRIVVHAYGKCQTSACDWGSQAGTMDGSGLIAKFSPTPNRDDTSRVAQITSHIVPEGLDVLVENKFQNPAGPRGNTSHHVFIASDSPVQ